MLLTGARIWPRAGTGPWADLVTTGGPGSDRGVLALHVLGGAVLLALVAGLRGARWPVVLVLVAFASGYAIPDARGGWFAYTPQAPPTFPASIAGGGRWAVVHAMVLAPIAASAVAYALGRRGQAVEEPAGPDDLGAG